jgi:LmbE family N-acetylglucosaminyl deacetylase
MRILIFAAHPDDEVLGMGGTIKKLSRQNQVHLCVVSEGATAQYVDEKMIQIRKESCKKSSKILGITNITFLDFPDMRLDTIPHLEMNKSLEQIISKIKPEMVFTTPNHDLNKDHRIVFDSTLIATRSTTSNVKEILSYELPGAVKTPFLHNRYVNISKEIKYKINAFKMYKSEIKNFPHPRSIKAIENLSIQRGIESGLKNAEAFQIIKSIIS